MRNYQTLIYICKTGGYIAPRKMLYLVTVFLRQHLCLLGKGGDFIFGSNYDHVAIALWSCYVDLNAGKHHAGKRLANFIET